MTTPIATGGDPLFALAAMIVERDGQRADIDDQNLRTAHAEEQRQLGRQIEALHDAADDIRVGAWISGGLTVVGGAIAAYGHGAVPADATDAVEGKFKALASGGQSLKELGGSMGRLFGDAWQADDEADAKQAELLHAKASERADEAGRHHERMDQNIERSLDAIDQALDSEDQGNLAIIANV